MALLTNSRYSPSSVMDVAIGSSQPPAKTTPTPTKRQRTPPLSLLPLPEENGVVAVTNPASLRSTLQRLQSANQTYRIRHAVSELRKLSNFNHHLQLNDINNNPQFIIDCSSAPISTNGDDEIDGLDVFGNSMDLIDDDEVGQVQDEKSLIAKLGLHCKNRCSRLFKLKRPGGGVNTCFHIIFMLLSIICFTTLFYTKTITVW